MQSMSADAKPQPPGPISADNLPERWEIVNGEPRPKDATGPRHGRAQGQTFVLLRGYNRRPGGPPDRPGGWWFSSETTVEFGLGQVRLPDVAGWRRERMPEMPDGPFFELAPDWACEISLPFTDKVERASKAPVYPREKVRHTWLIDPLMKTLEVFRLDGDSYRLVTTYRGSARVRVEPFDAFELELSSLWTK